MNEPSQPDLTLVPTKSIRVAQELNPRKKFSDADTSAFAARISQSKWVSPLLVRRDPDGEGYLLVAGERRYRAVTHLGWAEVPVTIKEMDDAEHRKLALAENIDRKDLTIAEEALAARDHVDAYGGDHAQAADALGWPVKRLKHRLQLLHATQDVMEALLHDRIQLGHAELLATLPAENQGKALPRILEQGITVGQLREQLNGFASPLATAIFDVTECHACTFNSECQRGLFAEHIDGGLCTNKPCFTAKTEQALHAKREELKSEFGTVVLLSEKVPGTSVPLVKLGAGGVGEAQFNACRTCEFRGAAITDTPGKSIGQVAGPLCFNVTCHQGMTEAYRAMLNPAPNTAAETVEEDAQEPQAKTQPATTAPAKPKPGTKPGKSGKAAKKATVRSTAKSVVNQYAGAIRKAAEAAIQQTPTIPLAMSVYGLLRAAADECPNETFSSICKSMGIAYKDRSDTMKRPASEVVLWLAGKTDAELQDIAQRLTLHLFGTRPDDPSFQGKLNRRALAANLAARAGIQPAIYLQVDQEYLAAHTKAGIEGVLEDSGFRAWCLEQEDGKKRYAGIVGKGKDDMIAAVLETGFDFTGFIPAGFEQERAAWEGFKRS